MNIVKKDVHGWFTGRVVTPRGVTIAATCIETAMDGEGRSVAEVVAITRDPSGFILFARMRPQASEDEMNALIDNIQNEVLRDLVDAIEEDDEDDDDE